VHLRLAGDDAVWQDNRNIRRAGGLHLRVHDARIRIDEPFELPMKKSRMKEKVRAGLITSVWCPAP
jgi:hypothetical protein